MKYRILTIFCLIGGFTWSDVTVEVCGLADKICTVTIPSEVLAELTTSDKFEKYLLSEVGKINPFYPEKETYFMSVGPVEVPEDGQTMRVEIAKDSEIVEFIGESLFIMGHEPFKLNPCVEHGKHSLNNLCRSGLKFELDFKYLMIYEKEKFYLDLNKKNLDFSKKLNHSINLNKLCAMRNKIFEPNSGGFLQFASCAAQILGITLYNRDLTTHHTEFPEDKVIQVRECLKELGFLEI